ncbi:MAG: hypothetical protein QW253_05780 [Metallosphaera sp.]
MEEVEWKPVIWYVGAVKIKSGKRKSVKLNLGYCTFGKGVAFMSWDLLHVFVVQSVDIHKAGGRITCGDDRWCFNLKCSLNKAEVDRFREYGISTREELEKYHRFLEKCLEELKKIYGEEILKYEKGMIAFERGSPIEVESTPKNSS